MHVIDPRLPQRVTFVMGAGRRNGCSFAQQAHLWCKRVRSSKLSRMSACMPHSMSRLHCLYHIGYMLMSVACTKTTAQVCMCASVTSLCWI